MNAHREDEARRAQSQAILERIRQETEPQTGALERVVARGGAHFSARDADQEDRLEVIGTRIGRLIGLTLFLGLLAMFVVNHFLS